MESLLTLILLFLDNWEVILGAIFMAISWIVGFVGAAKGGIWNSPALVTQYIEVIPLLNSVSVLVLLKRMLIVY
ncbi:hypothetical protein BKA61DRAFT_612431 [Leptodontidium sp. MPI-SDFR-AT-0119]|nr:hypothetical protein BKA61DRAFT_612431 [Leptodontidium sp. MPI-SDFR-AT-0119]